MITILIITAIAIVNLIAWLILDPARPLKVRRYSKEVDRLLEMEKGL